MNMTLDAKIESILFFKNQPMTFKELAKIFNINESEIKSSLESLKKNLEGRGVQLVFSENEVTLATHSEMSAMIEAMTKEELMKDLSKAALETLSIIVYKGPISRSELDYIRGVNSQFILRALTIRGLVEKKTNPKDERTFIYEPSLDLLKFLGINSKEEIPQYQDVQNQLDDFINQKEENKEDGNTETETH
ncbi:SMC-Scp complex subunit ScpB [Candidatus Nomurabacteria bacterium]|nr:SMC-Scp complex subunit ScpB [Candidatus Nomurabacteria bacterium]